jgi:thiamine-monophosphate kinase
MSENTKRTDVNELGEFGLIDHLTLPFVNRRETTVKGIGDDAAVIKGKGKDFLVTTDMLVEGIHFDLMYTPLKHLGYKAVVVNLSDIFAMNGMPEQITVSIALSNRFSVEALEELYEGIRSACEFYDVDLVGGDTTSSPKGLVISVTAIGRANTDQITYRSGAKPGDIWCVSGDLGAAYIGLQILEREKQIFLESPEVQPDLENQDYVIGRQLKPEVRRELVLALSKAGVVPSAMIDISDGLASEVFHICKQSQVGALIEESQVPIHEQTQLMALKFNLDPITCALNGGEDYELLFTVSQRDFEKLKYLPGIYAIGDVLPQDDGIHLRSKGGKKHLLEAQGWRHFRNNNDK